ncbi:cytochrome P450 18a1-like [Amphiura filiformis]|uniref:cytochrome P450 18a1-like n=1 Tax=Amphiura filiformis TaxID=82378 RepID=UPI003B227A59
MAFWHLFAAFFNLRLVLVTILSFIVAYIFIVKFRRPSNIPPGPWCFPLLGYLPNIAVYSRFYGLPLPAVLLQLSKKYGCVFSLYLGDQLCVVLNSQEAVKEAFMNPKLNDRPTATHFQNDEATGIVNASGPNWKAQRAFTLGVFRRFGVGKAVFETQICSELEILFKHFEDQNGASFDPSSLILNTISNITSLDTVAHRYEYGDKEFKNLLHVEDRIVKLAGTAGFKNIVKILRLLPSKANEILAKTKNEFMAIVNGNIMRRKNKFDSGTIECLIDVYLKKLYEKENLSEYINDESVGRTVASLFMAGTDTSSYQILWVLVYLLRHPKIFKKVQDEIDDTVGRDRLPTMDDQCDLPFTQAVINECMRLCATVPMGVMHAAAEDATLLDIPYQRERCSWLIYGVFIMIQIRGHIQISLIRVGFWTTMDIW